MVINWSNVTVPAAYLGDSPRLVLGPTLNNAADVSKAAVLPYARTSSGSWWLLPVANNVDFGTIGARIADRNPTLQPALILSREVAHSTPTVFADVRVVVIPNLPGGRKAAIDYTNYEEVKKSYNLAD